MYSAATAEFDFSKIFGAAHVMEIPFITGTMKLLGIERFMFNNEKKIIYFCRMSGIINSMLGKKSWYRPSLDWFINSKKIKNHQWEKKE